MAGLALINIWRLRVQHTYM